MADFKSGARKSSEPRMGPPNAMIADAKAALTRYGSCSHSRQVTGRAPGRSVLMQAAVKRLTIDDMVGIAAYTASREP
jgi:hypothetical protein